MQSPRELQLQIFRHKHSSSLPMSTADQVQREDSTADDDLALLVQMRVKAQKQQHQISHQPGSSDDASDDDPSHDDQDSFDAAEAAASKFVRSAKANKAGRRKAKKAAASAAPAGDAADSAVAGPASSQEAKHERKQKQKQQKQQQANASGSVAGSSSGIAEGRMSVVDEEMLKHALTQMNYLKQVAPFTFEIQKGVFHP